MLRRLAWMVFLLLVAGAPRARAAETIRVLVPDRGNLQYMSFWLAQDFLREEGLAVELVVPPAPQQTESFFERGEADVAVLPPPVYVTLIAKKVPVVLVANLLENDPIALVVRRRVFEERRLDRHAPIRARLEGIRGLKLGIAPHPPTRLRAMYAAAGLDADRDVSLVILHGKEQNAAYRSGQVDALFAHTPYVEQAIVKDEAVVLVDPCSGEVPELAHRQIHALATTRAFLGSRRPVIEAFVRAIAKGQSLVHRSRPEALAVLRARMPERDPRELATIVDLYEPAIPKSPAVSAAKIPGAVEMFPAGMPRPDLTGIDLGAHVDALAPPSRRGWWIVGGVGALVLLAILLATRRSRVPAQRSS